MFTRRLVVTVSAAAIVAAGALAFTPSAAAQSSEKQGIFVGAKPLGPYSPAVQVGDMLFLSGQIGRDASGTLVEGGVQAEARQAMENLGDLLEEAGMTYANVVRTTIYLTSIDDYAAVNETYASFFGEGTTPPARSTVAVAAIPGGAHVEIDFIAVR